MQLSKQTRPQHTIIHKAKPAPQAPDVGLVLLDGSLRPIAFDRGAAAILNHANQDAIPEEILRTLRGRKLAELSSIKTVFRVGKSEYMCRAYVVECEAALLGQSIVVLHLERDSLMGNAMYEAALKYNLTEREQEALKGISMGLSNKQLAERMTISPNTVRAFLRFIMVKMGVTSRSAIIAKILQDRDKFERVVSLTAKEELAV
jgi:DNA-binding NarL/FixJ family response regulator